jgi:hypothetical protein
MVRKTGQGGGYKWEVRVTYVAINDDRNRGGDAHLYPEMEALVSLF